MVTVIFRKLVCALILPLLLLLPGSAAWAGGSFAFEDLQPVLGQQPVLAKWLADSLEFDAQGDAIRIGQNVNPHLGGQRLGPYVILARPKGAAGPFTLEVTVETKLICKDANGKIVDVPQARTIRERFSSISVRQYQSGK